MGLLNIFKNKNKTANTVRKAKGEKVVKTIAKRCEDLYVEVCDLEARKAAEINATKAANRLENSKNRQDRG